MAARTNRTGEWTSPTREITKSHLIRLIDESRHCEAAVEMIRDVPTRQDPAAAPEFPVLGRCNSMHIDLRSLGDPDPLAIPQDVAAPDPRPATFWSEPDAEPATATPAHAPMTEDAMPVTAAPAQRLATGARRGRKRAASVRLLLCLGVLVVLCLSVLVVLDLGTWA